MDKPSRSYAKPLRELLGKVVGETFTRQGFASAELVTRWTEIVGAEIAAHSEPVKVQWLRPGVPSLPSAAERRGGSGRGVRHARPARRRSGGDRDPAPHQHHLRARPTPAFLGWRASERIALRQAPLRRPLRKSARQADPAATARIAASMPEIADDDLRQALARLGAAVKRD